MSAGLSVLADAARFPVTWFYLGGLAWVAEMAWRIWCWKTAIATTHQLVMTCAAQSVSMRRNLQSLLFQISQPGQTFV
ncbi:hypothetical protein V8C35DRAFT_214120 [Trichoderma chlorosporum]